MAKPVPVPGSFTIDATEVTRGQYRAWLASKPSTNGQSSACTWNTSFVPPSACMAQASVCQGPGCDDHPQPCVDMCDAAAYCRALGRTLCSAAHWGLACSSGGTNPFFYGPSLVPNTCNDGTAGKTTTMPVASQSGCQPPHPSAYSDIFDMIGNLAEWVENCSGSDRATDMCKPLGLAFGHTSAAPRCDQSIYARRSATLDTIGFRCCTP